MEPLPSTIYLLASDPREALELTRTLGDAGHECLLFQSAHALICAHDAATTACLLLEAGSDGLSIQEALVERGDLSPIVFVADVGAVEIAVRVLRAGALDVLARPVSEATLLQTVAHAISVGAARSVQVQWRNDVMQRFGKLTPRETEVFGLVVRGRLNKTIAADLGTVEKTIKVHRARVMRKMGARSLPELVQLASVVEASVSRRPSEPLRRPVPAAQPPIYKGARYTGLSQFPRARHQASQE